MTRKVFLILLALVLALSVGLVACAPAEEEEEEEDDILYYYEGVSFITEEETENIIEVTENRTKILFEETTPFVAGIGLGDVLVCNQSVPGAEYGFLVRVIEVSDDGKVVEVEPATLEDVIEEGVVSATGTISLEDVQNNALWTMGVEVLQLSGGYDFSYSPAEGVTIEGYLDATADTEVYIEAGFWKGLKEFEFVVSPSLEMGATLRVEQGIPWDKQYTIVTVQGPPIPIWGPVSITPELELVVGTTGTVDALLETTVTYDRGYDVGLSYDRNRTPRWEMINEIRGEGATLEEPSFSGHAEARVFGGALFSATAGIRYVAEAALGTELLGNIRASGEIETSPWRWQYDLDLYLSAQILANLYLCGIAEVEWESGPWDYPDPPYKLAYGASGRVTTGGVEGLDGVQINFSGGYSSVSTDEDGYWCKHLLRGEVEATAEKTGYTFDPPSITITRSASELDFQVAEGACHFADPNLEAAIRDAINKPIGEIYPSDLEGLTSLDADQRNIGDLTGLECCTNLTDLNLADNQIIDISPLDNLTNLTHLNLADNQIIDISPVDSLTNLTHLNLADNQIIDISPVDSLTNLTRLYLYINQIIDISPLDNLTNLTDLNLGSNQLTDIWPLANLTNLTDLNLESNQIVDISPLANLTSLTWLDLWMNQIIDISPLDSLTNLTFLQLGRNQLTDISPLANLTNLTDLFLGGNQIIDISPLVQNEGLGTGDYIDLRMNPLSIDSRDIYIPQLEARGVFVDYF